MSSLLCAALCLLSLPAASEEPPPPTDEAPTALPLPPAPVPVGRKILWGLEGVANFALMQATTVPIHEVVHWGVLQGMGVPTEGIYFVPFQQHVIVTDETFEAMTDAQIFWVAMAPQVWDPLTPALPQWIHKPEDGTWYLRFCAMYYLYNVMFQGVANMTQPWGEFASGEYEKDIGISAKSLTDSRGGQAAFLAGTTLLLGTNIALRWPHVRQSWHIVTHKADTWDLPERQAPSLTFHVTADTVAATVSQRF